VADERPGIRELDQRIPFLLSQLGTYVSDDFKRRLAPLDVHPRINAVLVALAGTDGQSQRQLSARLGLHRNVMVSLIDTLEEQGLVRRKPHPDDRRAFAVTLTDKAGEQIGPIIRGARADKGMPPIEMSDADIVAVAEYIHSMLALSPRQGMPPPGEEPVVLNILVGDAAAGQQYFAAKCSTCHSTTGDLQGIATRVPDPKTLQNLWVSGGAAGGRGRGAGGGAAGGANPRAIIATVVTASGEKVEGPLLRLDDFYVAVAQPDGTVRSFTRRDGIPKVELKDPLEGHRKLLAELTDKNMHDVTAYLVTLK